MTAPDAADGGPRCDNPGVTSSQPESGPAVGPSIVVAGEALVDLIVRPSGEITPLAGGGPFNSARAIARLGTRVAWLGALSRDRFGRMLDAALRDDGVDLRLARRTDLPTTLALAELDAEGAATYRFYVEGTSASAVTPDAGDTLPASTRAVLLGTLGLVLEPIATTLEGLVSRLPDDTLLLLDPNARPAVIPDASAWRARIGRLLSRADVVKASTEDLAFLRPGEPPDEAAAWLAARGARAVIVTNGGRPVSVLAGGVLTRVETPAVDVVDTVGAGDTFGGAFLACLVNDGVGREGLAGPEAVLRAARFAVRASSFVCGRAGADPPTLAQLGGWPRRS